jgi:hypothetical protein
VTNCRQTCDRPLLLVDIDGVLSLFGFAPDRIPPRGRWHQVDGMAHLLSEEAAEHLLDLADAYEPVWCSGWEDRANEHLPHVLRVGPFPHLTFEPGSPGHWKLAAIDAFAGPRRALAWIDDDLSDACDAWARRRPGPTLLVRTDPATGLTAALAERLRAWAGDLRRREVSSIAQQGDRAT